MSALLSEFADLCALLYHEARNVRHLIEEGYASTEEYGKLDWLPDNSKEAWRRLQPIRNTAKGAENSALVRRVFEDKFGLGLANTERLFKNPNWRHAKLYGGNQWANIARALSNLSVSLDNGDLDFARKLLPEVWKMKHNTGYVWEKFERLEKAVR